MIEVSQENLERQIMDLLLQGDHPVLTVLQQQYAAAKIVNRKFSGVGFFLHFEVPENVPLVEPLNFEAGGMSIDLEDKQDPGFECTSQCHSNPGIF
jgi:hypothetical protein